MASGFFGLWRIFGDAWSMRVADRVTGPPEAAAAELLMRDLVLIRQVREQENAPTSDFV